MLGQSVHFNPIRDFIQTCCVFFHIVYLCYLRSGVFEQISYLSWFKRFNCFIWLSLPIYKIGRKCMRGCVSLLFQLLQPLGFLSISCGSFTGVCNCRSHSIQEVYFRRSISWRKPLIIYIAVLFGEISRLLDALFNLTTFTSLPFSAVMSSRLAIFLTPRCRCITRFSRSMHC